MADYSLPYFGSIDLDDLDGQYDVEILIEERKVHMSLIFDEPEIDPVQMDEVKRFIENLEKWDTQNRSYIKRDYDDENGDTVRFYFQYHLDYMAPEQLPALFGPAETAPEIHDHLLNKLQLVKVALYPHEEHYLAIFDYSFGRQFTNHVIVISTDREGNLHHMDMES